MAKNEFKKTAREKFWDSFNPILSAKHFEAKADDKEPFAVKISKKLHEDFKAKVKKDKIKKADIVNKAIIEYTYG